jgi:hypothetical protein
VGCGSGKYECDGRLDMVGWIEVASDASLDSSNIQRSPVEFSRAGNRRSIPTALWRILFVLALSVPSEMVLRHLCDEPLARGASERPCSMTKVNRGLVNLAATSGRPE